MSRFKPYSYKKTYVDGTLLNPRIDPRVNVPVKGVSSSDWKVKRCAVCKKIYNAWDMIGFVCYRCLKNRLHEKYDWDAHFKDAHGKMGLMRR